MMVKSNPGARRVNVVDAEPTRPDTAWVDAHWAAPLRQAARLLLRMPAGLVTAMTISLPLATDSDRTGARPEDLEPLAAGIARAYCLDSTVSLSEGCATVRLARPSGGQGGEVGA